MENSGYEGRQIHTQKCCPLMLSQKYQTPRGLTFHYKREQVDEYGDNEVLVSQCKFTDLIVVNVHEVSTKSQAFNQMLSCIIANA